MGILNSGGSIENESSGHWLLRAERKARLLLLGETQGDTFLLISLQPVQ